MDSILSSSFTEKTIPNVIISHRYKAQDTPARKTFEQALTGAFMSAVIKDLRPSALPFVASLIRHYTMVAVAQQCGEWAEEVVVGLAWAAAEMPSGRGASEEPSGWFLLGLCFLISRLLQGNWYFGDGCNSDLKIVTKFLCTVHLVEDFHPLFFMKMGAEYFRTICV